MEQTIRESLDLIFFVAQTIAVPEECSKMNQALDYNRSSWFWEFLPSDRKINSQMHFRAGYAGISGVRGSLGT